MLQTILPYAMSAEQMYCPAVVEVTGRAASRPTPSHDRQTRRVYEPSLRGMCFVSLRKFRS